MSRASLGLLLVIWSWPGCDWTRFDDLSQAAPVRELTAAGDFHPASFGDAVLGLKRPGAPGTMLVAAGNGAANLTTAVITASGEANLAAADGAELLAMGPPQRLEALVEGPTGSSVEVPLVYVATEKGVRLINPLTFKWPYTSPPLVIPPASDPPFTPLALATVELGNGPTRGLAIGGAGALRLQRIVQATGLISPELDKKRDLTEGWGAGACSVGTTCVVLATGTLGGTTVVVAGFPRRNQVRVLVLGPALGPAADLETFLDNPGEPPICLDAASTFCFRELTTPAGAAEFGAALLLGDVDGASPGAELLVGAPGSGQVFTYSSLTANPTVVAAPAGAGRFGEAHALGKVTGEDQPLLVVGAPATAVDGIADAGGLFVHRLGSTVPLDQSTSLATPTSGRGLGRRLALLPFQDSAGSPRELLAAAGSGAVYVFFGGLPGQRDLRGP